MIKNNNLQGDFMCLFRKIYLILALFTILNAQWTDDPTENTPVVIGANSTQVMATACSDMDGGAIVAWVDRGIDLYAQNIDKYGYIQWDSLGVPVCTAQGEHRPLKMISDDHGGGVLLWKDYRYLLDGLNKPSKQMKRYTNTLFVQRIDSNGNCLWQENGVQISQKFDHFDDDWAYTTNHEQIFSDGRGGFFITWSQSDTISKNDYFIRNMSATKDIRVNHISSSGELLFSDIGISIDRTGGPISAAVGDSSDIYILIASKGLFRVGYDGTSIWDDPVELNEFHNGKVISDGEGGVFAIGSLGWIDTIYVRKINKHGEILWKDLDIFTDVPIAPEDYLKIFNGPENGIYIRWVDYNTWSYYSQLIDSTGNLLWEYPGKKNLRVSLVFEDKNYFYDIKGGDDERHQYYVHKFDKNGDRVWEQDSVMIYDRPILYWPFGSGNYITDMKGGFIMIAEDYRHFSQSWDIFAQQIGTDGKLGDVMTSIDPVQRNSNPMRFQIFPNYPNPFNGSTNIKYQVYRNSNIKVKIYNLNGELVYKQDLGNKNPGEYSFFWEPKDSLISTGIYFVNFSTNDRKETQQILYLK